MSQAPYHFTKSCFDVWIADVVRVYALVRAFGQFPCNWAHTPIQNRRLRRCGEGLDHISLHCPSHVRTEGRDHGSRSPSRLFVTFQHHIGVFAHILPPMLKCCSVVQR
jgi:hypothetical protein